MIKTKYKADRLSDMSINDQQVIVGRVANLWQCHWENEYPSVKEIAERLCVKQSVVRDAMGVIADAYENMKADAEEDWD